MIHGETERLRAADMSEQELRQRVDRLLEQAAREALNPEWDGQRRDYLHSEEIFYLMGVGPLPGAAGWEKLRKLVEGGGS